MIQKKILHSKEGIVLTRNQVLALFVRVFSIFQCFHFAYVFIFILCKAAHLSVLLIFILNLSVILTR
jgi:hypothetical protein